PNSVPIVAHIVAWSPKEASRKRHSVVAGKSAVAQRDGGRVDCPGQRRARGDDVRHGEPPGDDASPTTVVSEGAKSWLPGPRGTRSQWRDRAGLTPASTH